MATSLHGQLAYTLSQDSYFGGPVGIGYPGLGPKRWATVGGWSEPGLGHEKKKIIGPW